MHSIVHGLYKIYNKILYQKDILFFLSFWHPSTIKSGQKGYADYMQMYVTGRKRRGEPHKVNIFPDQDHSKLSWDMCVGITACQHTYQCELTDLSYHMNQKLKIWCEGSCILHVDQVNFKDWGSCQFDL